MTTRFSARWWVPGELGVRCELCPHNCLVKKGNAGTCGTRKNVDGALYAMNYGRVSVLAVDSIEKKPIFHYKPGSTLLSVGTSGCNLDCDYCQNSQLARGDVGSIPSTFYSPQALVSEALGRGVDGIAWTFNEPVVWAEYIVDVAKLARSKGLYSMVNTNGYISGKAREELLGAIDVIKVDVKSFREGTYRMLCRGELLPVLETCVAARKAGLHLEIAYPMIPAINDSTGETTPFFKWVKNNLGNETPLHLFRFSPSFRLSSLKEEPMARMMEAREKAMGIGLKYVYFGGVVSAEEQNTRCPRCGAIVISRVGKESSEKSFVKKEQVSKFCPSFSDVKIHLVDGRCPKCGEPISVVA